MGGIGVKERPSEKLVALSKSDRPISDVSSVWGYKIAFMLSNSILDPSGAIKCWSLELKGVMGAADMVSWTCSGEGGE